MFLKINKNLHTYNRLKASTRYMGCILYFSYDRDYTRCSSFLTPYFTIAVIPAQQSGLSSTMECESSCFRKDAKARAFALLIINSNEPLLEILEEQQG
jgi:hypothetical protein